MRCSICSFVLIKSAPITLRVDLGNGHSRLTGFLGENRRREEAVARRTSPSSLSWKGFDPHGPYGFKREGYWRPARLYSRGHGYCLVGLVLVR
jgi:hypothetical protein